MKKREFFYFLGCPFSPFYSLVMRFREFLYQKGVFRTVRVGVPVISIGNLTMGGSGKTPVVQYTARFLQEQGYHPAVISRGYGGRSNESVNVVSDGRQVLLSASEAGDEPRFLAETLEGIPVLTGTKRKKPALQAVNTGADILVLDDGFQHMALGRDIDLVLFNADFLAGNSRVFPGGDLREPVKALQRCHGFIITGICERNRDRAEQFKALLLKHFPEHPVFLSRYSPSSLITFLAADDIAQALPLQTMVNKKIFGFSGIAHPKNFQDTLHEMDFVVAGFHAFADHHVFTNHDMEQLFHRARSCQAEALVTTEKDLVKLRVLQGNGKGFPIYALRMEVKMENDFNQFILEQLSR